MKRKRRNAETSRRRNVETSERRPLLLDFSIFRRFDILLVASLVVFVGGWAAGGLEGSKHDFRSQEWAGNDGCTACHTPERDEPPTEAPLWDPNADLNRTFGTSLAQSKSAGLGTNMCLRCHDGTIARDNIPVPRKVRFVNTGNPGLFSSAHGGSDHPVAVEYPKFDPDFRPAPSVVAGRAVLLPEGRVECSSCHDPHNMTGERFMLVRSNARSALCLTCHRK